MKLVKNYYKKYINLIAKMPPNLGGKTTLLYIPLLLIIRPFFTFSLSFIIRYFQNSTYINDFLNLFVIGKYNLYLSFL